MDTTTVLRFAPCPICHCRKRVLDDEDGMQILRCLECGEEIRMTPRMSQRVHVTLRTRHRALSAGGAWPGPAGARRAAGAA